MLYSGTQSCLPFDPIDCSPPRLFCPLEFSRQELEFALSFSWGSSQLRSNHASHVSSGSWQADSLPFLCLKPQGLNLGLLWQADSFSSEHRKPYGNLIAIEMLGRSYKFRYLDSLGNRTVGGQLCLSHKHQDYRRIPPKCLAGSKIFHLLALR